MTTYTHKTTGEKFTPDTDFGNGVLSGRYMNKDGTGGYTTVEKYVLKASYRKSRENKESAKDSSLEDRSTYSKQQETKKKSQEESNEKVKRSYRLK